MSLLTERGLSTVQGSTVQGSARARRNRAGDHNHGLGESPAGSVHSEELTGGTHHCPGTFIVPCNHERIPFKHLPMADTNCHFVADHTRMEMPDGVREGPQNRGVNTGDLIDGELTHRYSS